MIWILLSILFSSVVVIIFKVFEKQGVDTFRGIVVNYAVCAAMGTLMTGNSHFWLHVHRQPWFGFALLLGILFIAVFNAIGLVAQRIAVSVSMVSAKMSVIIPVLFAVFFLGESITVVNVAGIALSLLALYFTTQRAHATVHASRLMYLLPAIVFAGSGSIDTLIKFLEVNYLNETGTEQVLSVAFASACVGGVFLLLMRPGAGGRVIGKRNLLGGILLGLPNYCSMYFLFRALHESKVSAAIVFPLNNIAIVLVSTLLAWFFFHEKVSRVNLLGIVLAVISIILISVS